jgi:hypothetical protein
MNRYKNKIDSWTQGRFIDGTEYDHFTDEDKKKINSNEMHFVRPYPKGNHICFCEDPDDAKWIAERLNLASYLENKNTKTSEEEGKVK